jgi:hypothetical protein
VSRELSQCNRGLELRTSKSNSDPMISYWVPSGAEFVNPAPLTRTEHFSNLGGQFFYPVGLSIPARKGRIVHVENDAILIGLPDTLHSHEGVVVLATISHPSRGRRR